MSSQSVHGAPRSWKLRAAVALLAIACLLAGLSQLGRLLFVEDTSIAAT